MRKQIIALIMCLFTGLSFPGSEQEIIQDEPKPVQERTIETEQQEEKEPEPVEQPEPEAPFNPDEAYSLEEAKQIALDDAGMKEENVFFVLDMLNRKGPPARYEIEFYRDDDEYDYTIDAVTGKIIAFDTDAEYVVQPDQIEEVFRTKPAIKPSDETIIQPPQEQYYPAGSLTQKKALRIALDYIGIPNRGLTNKQFLVKSRNHQRIIEVDFNVGSIRFMCDIDAINGDVLSLTIE